jgi:MFS family permease
MTSRDQVRSGPAAAAAAGREPDPGASPAASRAARLLGAVRPLRHRGYAVLWAAGMVSNIGSWMQAVAVGALLISNTGQATWAVLVAAAAFLPIGLLSPVGGALADRVARRPVLVGGNLAAAAVAVVLAVLIGSGHEDPSVLVALVGVQGAASALIGPFQQAILPDLVPKSEFLPAIALNSAQWNLGRIVGPAAAGATVAAFGYPIAFDANAVSFLAVVIALAFVKLAPPAGRGGKLLASVREGFTVARREPSCWAAVCTIGLVALIASPFIALVPAMAERLSDGGSRAVAAATGTLTTAQGIGAVVGALCMAGLANRFGRGRLLRGSLLALPAVLILYGSAQTLWEGTLGLFLVGLVYLWVLSGLSTVVQLHAPQAYRGRVLSFYLVALGVAYPIGSLIQGPIVDRIGIGWTTSATAVLVTLVLAAAALLAPTARRALFRPAAADTSAADTGSPAGHDQPLTAPVEAAAQLDAEAGIQPAIDAIAPDQPRTDAAARRNGTVRENCADSCR